MNRDMLDKFGRLLMERVRDRAINDCDLIMTGHMKSPLTKQLHQRMSSFSAEQLAVVRSLVPHIVDNTLHHLLWTLEQESDVNVSVVASGEVVSSIRDESDGLTGELPGWIARFSHR